MPDRHDAAASERWVAIRSVLEQLVVVEKIHRRLMRSKKPTDMDGIMVRRLIRLLVAEWV